MQYINFCHIQHCISKKELTIFDEASSIKSSIKTYLTTNIKEYITLKNLNKITLYETIPTNVVDLYGYTRIKDMYNLISKFCIPNIKEKTNTGLIMDMIIYIYRNFSDDFTITFLNRPNAI
jgi:hypothetical protein